MTDERTPAGAGRTGSRREWLFRYEDSAIADDYRTAGLAFLEAMSEIARAALASGDPLGYLEQFAEIVEVPWAHAEGPVGDEAAREHGGGS